MKYLKNYIKLIALVIYFGVYVWYLYNISLDQPTITVLIVFMFIMVVGTVGVCLDWFHARLTELSDSMDNKV